MLFFPSLAMEDVRSFPAQHLFATGWLGNLLASRSLCLAAFAKKSASGIPLVRLLLDEPRLDLPARPVCLAQKCEAGFHARIHLEAADGDAVSHFDPAEACDELIDDRLQFDAVQGIEGMMGGRCHGLGFHFLQSSAIVGRDSV